jgi:DNA mismatch endonuclease Vsr
MTRKPWPTDVATSARMRASKSHGTRLEERVRAALRRLGYRYRVQYKPLPDLRHRADFVYVGPKVVVDVRGCFWHGCPEHAKRSRTNEDAWEDKFARNRERDRRVEDRLTSAGWLVIVVWEHDDVEDAVRRIADAVVVRRPGRQRDAV